MDTLRLKGDFSVEGSRHGRSVFTDANIDLFVAPLPDELPDLTLFELNEQWFVDSEGYKEGLFADLEYAETKNAFEGWEGRNINVVRLAAK